ncbi:helix-turn-helix transcriptional regulator [Tuberibacillus sp. Marseille-P3662]|uniref:helix-turn-helix transcriptional regulator n=1 Tax=Tuberibacillus sp. Marseille-P3662 TaxID=1965358 RepID=UPI000A1C97D7|nr:AraC family transcriptional regulator [Tuberibacillus sp. Marseille-P3662]
MSVGSTPDQTTDFAYYRQSKSDVLFHSHTWYEIYYFHRGKCNYLIGDQIYALVPGDLIIMNGMTLHRPKLFEHAEYVRSVIHFEPAYFQNVLQPLGMENILQPFEQLQSYCIRLNEAERQETEWLLQKMNNFQQQHDVVSDYRFYLTFLDLLTSVYIFFQKPMATIKAPSSEKEHHVQRIMSFIESCYMQDLTMQRLENELHLSKSYLSKVFKTVTGVTVFNYLYQRRINQAKILFVLEPDNSVTEVCYRVGFKHLAHFSKVFKQLEGCSPEQYRKVEDHKQNNHN